MPVDTAGAAARAAAAAAGQAAAGGTPGGAAPAATPLRQPRQAAPPVGAGRRLAPRHRRRPPWQIGEAVAHSHIRSLTPTMRVRPCLPCLWCCLRMRLAASCSLFVWYHCVVSLCGNMGLSVGGALQAPALGRCCSFVPRPTVPRPPPSLQTFVATSQAWLKFVTKGNMNPSAGLAPRIYLPCKGLGGGAAPVPPVPVPEPVHRSCLCLPPLPLCLFYLLPPPWPLALNKQGCHLSGNPCPRSTQTCAPCCCNPPPPCVRGSRRLLVLGGPAAWGGGGDGGQRTTQHAAGARRQRRRLGCAAAAHRR